ncbi:MAG: hypothetical protein WB696_28585 [Chthoniobacterales bacterium]
MEPKKEHTEHEENGAKVERNTYDDPETKTRAEEKKAKPQQTKRRRTTSCGEIDGTGVLPTYGISCLEEIFSYFVEVVP